MAKLLKCAGIYVLRNRDNGKCYVGKDKRLGTRAKQHLSLKTPDCPAIHKAIKKYGADNFDVRLVPYPNISEDTLYEVEKWKIRQFRSHVSQDGYNCTWGGEGLDPETAREICLKKVADGTHHFQDSEFRRKIEHKRAEACREATRKTVRKQLADGTHNFQNSEVRRKCIEAARESNHKRIEAIRETSRENSLKRVADGTHPFLGGELQRKRVADGTHHLLSGEIQRKTARKRVEDGTNPFLDSQVSRKGNYAYKIKRKNQRREFYRWVSIILTAKSVCEERVYRKRIREGFFDKEIPNTSESEQLDLFN